jgi:nicotinamidase-related amidase
MKSRKLASNSRVAFLVIDMINDFLKNKKCKLYSPRFKAIIPRIKKFLKEGKKRNIPIVFVCDNHQSKDSICIKRWGIHAMRGTIGAKIVDELIPFVKRILLKEYNDAFLRSNLDITLRKLGVTEIALCGIQTNYCIRATAEGGYYRGYTVKVISDCVTDENLKSHKIGLKTISLLSGTVINSKRYLKAHDNPVRQNYKPNS